MNWISVVEDSVAEQYRLECNMHQISHELHNTFERLTHWTVALGLSNFQEAFKSDMQQLVAQFAQTRKLTMQEEFYEALVKVDVTDIKHRLLDRVMPNEIHTATRWPLGSINRANYNYWMRGLGFISYSTRSREVKELTGRCVKDVVVHHHFNKAMLDSIPFFGDHWWEQEFNDIRGRGMKYEVTNVTFAYNLVTHMIDCSLGYNIYTWSFNRWVKCG